jgi:hypothetical protein
MTLLRPNFRPESWAQNAGNGISGVQISKNFRGGMPTDPPSIASISAMIPSDLRLDPPLDCTTYLFIFTFLHRFCFFRHFCSPKTTMPLQSHVLPNFIVKIAAKCDKFRARSKISHIVALELHWTCS